MIAAGTIGLVSTRSFATGCIRLGTRSHWNHIVIATGRGTLIEAQPGGVREIPDTWYDDCVWLEREPLTAEQRAGVVAFVDDHARRHTPYNWPAIVVFGLRTFLPWLPHRLLDRWADNRPNVICSELAVKSRRAVGVNLFGGQLGATISPGGIDVTYRRLGW